MLTSKERSILKAFANPLRPSVQIGKAGLSPEVLHQLEEDIAAHELVKITVLNNSGLEAQELVQEILESLDAEFVSQLGNKLVIYRPSEQNLIDLS